MKHLRQGLVVIIVSVLFSGVALAGPANSEEPRSRGMERMAHFLQLDDSQRAQVEAAYGVYGPELRELRKEVREQRRALREASRGDFNEGDARAASQRLGAVMAESAYQSARLRHEIAQTLTQEQLEKLASHKGKGGNRHHRRHGSR